MTELFDAVSHRLKTIFTAHAALELEAEAIARHVERKATLLKQAAKLEEDGMKGLADELREHAGGLDPRRPTESVLPMLTQSQTTQQESNGREPSVNGSAEIAMNGTAQRANSEQTTEPPAANAACLHPTPDNPTLPEAVPVEPLPEAGNGRSTGRKKSR